MLTPCLRGALRDARARGLLGPGPIDRHVEHARGFAAVYEAVAVEPSPRRALDLGSGGGVPGLVLSETWTSAEIVLLDGSVRRASFLRKVVSDCALEGRVSVVGTRAETAGHDAEWREGFDLVVARSFGPPGVTAECGSPFLREGGWLVVSEPPDEAELGGRCAEDGLAMVGLSPALQIVRAFRYAAFQRVGSCPAAYPRRLGVPNRRPLF